MTFIIFVFKMIEVYKSLNHYNPELLWDLFCRKQQPYNLRNHILIQLPSAKVTKYGTNSIIFKGSLLWNLLPISYKISHTLSIFKQNMH